MFSNYGLNSSANDHTHHRHQRNVVVLILGFLIVDLSCLCAPATVINLASAVESKTLNNEKG